MHVMHTTFAIMLCAGIGCGPTPHGGDDDGTGPDATTSNPGDGSELRCEKIDLLFVIDNSGSMGQEQTNLIMNFPQFISVLNASGLDYRVAVTTTAREYHYTMATPIGSIPMDTGNGEDGEMIKPGNCNMTQRWIDKSDPDPAGTFSCVANVGTSGSGDEMPLGAMRDAFDDRMTDGTNMGFRRQNSLLGVVFLTDEEDCSYEQSVSLNIGQTLCDVGSPMEPPANYVQFLDTYTGHRSRWAAAAIAGPGPGQCSSGFGDADEATRLKSFLMQTGANAKLSSICDGDLSVSLMQVLALFQSACDDVIF